MTFMHDSSPDAVFLSGAESSSTPVPLALPDLAPRLVEHVPVEHVPEGAVRVTEPDIAPARRAAPAAESHAQRLAHLVSRLLAAPSEAAARQTVQDGLCALLRCRGVALRLLDDLLDDPPVPLDALHRTSPLDTFLDGATGMAPTRPEAAWLRIPILADHAVIGTLALEVGPDRSAFTPSARATAETVAHVLAQRLAHLRLLALAATPAMPATPVTSPAAPIIPAPSVDAAALRLAGVCDLMADAVLVADAAGRVVVANRAFRDLFGLSRAQTAPGVASAPLLKRARRTLEPLDPAIPIGPATATRPRRFLRRAPVRRVLEGHAHALHAADGTGLGSATIYRDITREHDTNERQRRFLGAVAHEVRTPLTSITGYAQLLVRALDRAAGEQAVKPETMTETLRARVTALAGQSARMTRLVRDMLDTGYLANGRLPLRLEMVEMVPLVAEVIAPLRLESMDGKNMDSKNMDGAHRSVALRAPRWLALRGDGARIEQIVRHLLENAIRFSPTGGAIVVTLRTQRGADGARWCVLRVRDRGAGVPAGYEETIFTPFAQLETAATRWISGIGLGLPLCRALAERHGGSLRALPRQRGGATFELRLPLAGPGASSGESADAPSLART